MKIDWRMQLPNILTVSRVAIIPVFVLVFYLPYSPWLRLLASLLFITASVTDYLDGILARKYQVQSKFGRCFDPIADKLLVAAALMMLVSTNSRDSIITIAGIIIISREILVSGLREFLAGANVSVPVTHLAKWKTGIQMTSIALLLIGKDGISLLLDFCFIREAFINGYISWMIGDVLGKSLLLISAMLTIVTGYKYWQVGAQNF